MKSKEVSMKFGKGGIKNMKVEAEKLVDMVRKDIPDRKIMKELGIKTRASLRKMYYDALVETGRIEDIPTERKMKRAPTKKRVLTIGKRGTILLSRRLLIDQFGFKEGDTFTVSKRKDAVTLRRG